MSTTIRISRRAHALIHALSVEQRLSMQETVERAVEFYRRQRMLAETNAAYAALRSDPEAEATMEQERAVWDETLGDGLEAV